MKTLGIITARAGSKRLPGKNKMMFGSKPLFQWTVDEAKKSSLDDIVISTDDKDISDALIKDLRLYGFTRPEWLCQARTPHLPVAQHAVEWMRLNHRKTYGAVMILQPTSPFRTYEHINDALATFEEDPRDSLISVDTKDRRNAAIYMVSTERLFSRECYIFPESGDSGRIVMDDRASIDINTLQDFKSAEKLLNI